jgi:6-phospho-beta-glucosidase
MTATRKIAVLGGGSPFTAALFEAIADSPYRLAPCRLTLFGRDPTSLRVMATRADARLASFEWRIDSTTEIDDALDGADYVIHQIRYGGLEGRERAEQLAERFGLPADETLGPAALHVALRSAPALQRMAARIASRCPKAVVLNLTNPLSLTTALMIRHGVAVCLGVCELPESTATAVARLPGIQCWDRITWEYVGLNHRGFLYNFVCDGRPALSMVIGAMRASSLFDSREVESLQAVPLKYFRLCRSLPGQSGRTRFVREVRQAVLSELTDNPHALPPSLFRRNVDWYSGAVVPLLSALDSDVGHDHVINVMGADGVVVERKARVSSSGIAVLGVTAPPPPVELWMRRFMAHERASLAAVLTRTASDIRNALELDPTVIGASSLQLDALAHELIDTPA